METQAVKVLYLTGSNSEVFFNQAVVESFRSAGGSPRLTNQACTHCLMYGKRQKKIIDDHMVRLVVEA